MLQKLSIRNYAIIDELVIEFHPQFNIITGETGAGKSILVGALGLVLGNRADSSVLHEEGSKCVVEASFRVRENEGIGRLLEENDLDQEDQLLLRREIAATGKSRSFINDTPVTLQVLRQIASQLVDLHQQFDTLELGEDDFQRQVVDSLAGNESLLKQYKTTFNDYTITGKKYTALKEQQSQAAKELDYYRFLFDELEEAAFTANEIENLEEELHRLSNVDSIKLVLNNVVYGLRENETPVVQQLKTMVQQLQSLRNVHSEVAALAERMLQCQVEIKDIADELNSINNNTEMDAERMQWVNDRIGLGYKLMKKHNASNTAELLSIQQDLEQKLQQVLHIDEDIEKLEKERAEKFEIAKSLASKLSANRKAVVNEFEKKVHELLQQVGMPNARLKVSITDLQNLDSYGTDHVKLLFDGNKSGRFEPLEKVASGGELSRLMLSIKSIVARKMQMPTLIFDEIDTGISGEAARQVGIIMKELAADHQVISITHQPQIAARAEAHFFVFKKEKAGLIKTQVRLLSDDERVDTIARMLNGEQISESALQTAREMVIGH
jgi:DNA repair protein RecN (Recombination protein N)